MERMLATNIMWCVDAEEDLQYLPSSIEVPPMPEEAIADYLSDITGFLHYGYELIPLVDECL